jgi:hypothetical protein
MDKTEGWRKGVGPYSDAPKKLPQHHSQEEANGGNARSIRSGVDGNAGDNGFSGPITGIKK